MLSTLLASSMLAIGILANTHHSVEKRQNEGTLTRLRCGTVNFLATAFLPKEHTTAFCSAYLQLPEQTYTSTATQLAAASTLTETNDRPVTISTRTVSTTVLSTSTTTIDTWKGTPACSAVPRYDWVRERRRQQTSSMAGIIESACSCLQIPAPAETIVEELIVTPTATMAVGTNIAAATTTDAHHAVATHTKFMFLVDSVPFDMMLPKNADPTRSLSDQILGFGHNESSLLQLAGSRMRNIVEMAS